MRKTLLTFTTALLLVPALSFAANPAKDAAFQWCETRDRCSFGFQTTKNGKYIKDIRAYNKCAQVPTEFPRIRVKNGEFSKTGKAKNVLDQTVTYTIKGKFKKPKKAVGTYDLDLKGCSAKPTKFTAKKVTPSPNEG